MKSLGRVLAVLAVLGGLVLGGLGLRALTGASDDRELADEITDSAAADRGPAGETARTVRRASREVQRLDAALQRLGAALYDFRDPERRTIDTFNAAAGALTALDYAEVDRVLTERTEPGIDRLRDFVRRQEEAQSAVDQSVMRLAEVLG